MIRTQASTLFILISCVQLTFAQVPDKIKDRTAGKVNLDSCHRMFTNTELYDLGKRDAAIYYRKKSWNPAAGSFFFAASIFLLTASIGILATKPNEKQLNYPDSIMWESPDYRKGYCKKAYNMKKRKVITGLFAGLLTTTAVVLVGFSTDMGPMY